MIGEMRCAFRHAATGAPRTEAAALAREGDESIEAAGRAAKAREAASQTATAEEVAKLLLHEAREALAVAQRRRLRAEGLEMVSDEPVHVNRLRRSGTRVEQFMTVAEAAQCVGCCEETIRRATWRVNSMCCGSARVVSGSGHPRSLPGSSALAGRRQPEEGSTMAVRKQCRAKGCKSSPRCDHPWWFDVMHQGRRVSHAGRCVRAGAWGYAASFVEAGGRESLGAEVHRRARRGPRARRLRRQLLKA
jgi:hypothetical protein